MAPDDLYYDFVKRRIGQCPTCGDCLTMDHDCGPLFNSKKKEEDRMEDRLMECPRCHSEKTTWIPSFGDGMITPICFKCRLSGPNFHTIDEAIKWWNTRATDPLLEKMAEALEGALDVIYNGLWDNDNRTIQIEQALQEYRERK